MTNDLIGIESDQSQIIIDKDGWMSSDISWGEQEHKARRADIAAAKRGEISLDDAKCLAENRRRAAGLTMGQAAERVSDHVRALRYAALATGGRIDE